MIQKPIEAIEKSDIDLLVADHVVEKRSLEYKVKLPGTSDSDRREFLGDASSFANAAGGDILFGVPESNGAPQDPLCLPSRNDCTIKRVKS